MTKQKLIKEKLRVSLKKYAELADVPEERANYSCCIRQLSLKSNLDVLSTVPTFDKVLDPKEIKAFVANERVGRALSYIERWKLSRELGKGEELLNTPYRFAVRRRDNLTNFAVVSNSCADSKIKVVELWTEFSYQYGFELDFPEVVLAVEGEVVFVLAFRPAEVMMLLDWYDVWDVPEITRNFKAKLEEYTRAFRQVYARKVNVYQTISNYDFSAGSVDEYIGNDKKRVVRRLGCILNKDWRRLKRLFNVGRIIYVAEGNYRRNKINNPLKDVVFTNPIEDVGVTFVYIKGDWDIEFPIGKGVIIRMVHDFTKVKRINQTLSE